MPIELKLPDIGEGIAEGEVVRWLVAEGASVKEDDPLTRQRHPGENLGAARADAAGRVDARGPRTGRRCRRSRRVDGGEAMRFLNEAIRRLEAQEI